ncbi:uncharacterized protein L969DRAFT_95531 [Mixia osmundae IAM 14324]|uniref:Uncharacterized protein n=1 Tax=Mixia osmundae (strain CBS 9802 / IAM 14324 / JCM 22182 / KY 12970) TaxID=764103 RepID=G7E7P2_MIXOS|nr:uncharacterized protein L969DRAFT_95531 [Mixia osmundae IAM 14324]KEI38452.1 hypothetical protein L969DRAFT_95531 [Mixia osmundae IAM 14324]GAA98852.1 hypothetical protein E5Q_05540 [Mixia osmundae IAM 14324]
MLTTVICLASVLALQVSGLPLAPEAQTVLSVDPSQISTASGRDGMSGKVAPGQSPSLTSANNFINFCGSTNQEITNGRQVKTGSCNPIPMGQLMAADKMPSARFQFPRNGQALPAGQSFPIQLAVANFDSGNFVSGETEYLAAPSRLDQNGYVMGHSHIVIQRVASASSTEMLDPTQFAVFKAMDGKAVNGVMSLELQGGLPAGEYRLASILSQSNHQAITSPVAARGAFDDVIYFSVGQAQTQAQLSSSAPPVPAQQARQPPRAPPQSSGRPQSQSQSQVQTSRGNPPARPAALASNPARPASASAQGQPRAAASVPKPSSEALKEEDALRKAIAAAFA